MTEITQSNTVAIMPRCRIVTTSVITGWKSYGPWRESNAYDSLITWRNHANSEWKGVAMHHIEFEKP